MFCRMRGSPKVSLRLSDAKGSGSLNFTYFGAAVPFRSSKRLGKGNRGQATNSPTKHQPERGGIQRPGRSCHLRGYHNYLWGWTQPQVIDSIDTTSTLLITTLATYDNQSIRSNGDKVRNINTTLNHA